MRYFNVVMCFFKFIIVSYAQSTFEDVVENKTEIKTTYAPSYHFSYGNGPKGPLFWSTFYPTCGGAFQSPIDINLDIAVDVKLEKLKWKNYELLPNRMIVINNEHTLNIKAFLPDELESIIFGGPLTDEYVFSSLHFHWGMEDSTGSEHTLNSKRYVMEMHCIHRKRDLTMEVASTMHNGLLVVAYFFDIVAHDNPAIAYILELYNQLIVDFDTPLRLFNTFRLSELIIPFDKDYITYQGSLTTPPCSEVVIWMISPYPATISKRQLTSFRKISEASGMQNNFRPLQLIGNRTVFLVLAKQNNEKVNYDEESDDTEPDNNKPSKPNQVSKTKSSYESKNKLTDESEFNAGNNLIKNF